MKKFMEPNVNVEVLDLVDVITTSDPTIGGGNANEGGDSAED